MKDEIRDFNGDPYLYLFQSLSSCGLFLLRHLNLDYVALMNDEWDRIWKEAVAI
jgi:hypothetical protein